MKRKRIARKFWHLNTANTLLLRVKPMKGVRYEPTTTPLAYTVPIMKLPPPAKRPPRA